MINDRPWYCQDCRVLMEHDEDKIGYFVCPSCGVEVWPPDMPLPTIAEEAASIAKDEAGKNEDDFIIPRRPGGSRSAPSRNRKHLLKKKSTSQLHKELCGPVDKKSKK